MELELSSTQKVNKSVFPTIKVRLANNHNSVYNYGLTDAVMFYVLVAKFVFICNFLVIHKHYCKVNSDPRLAETYSRTMLALNLIWNLFLMGITG